MRNLRERLKFNVYNFIISKIPIFHSIRNAFCRKMFKSCGKDIRIAHGTWIVGANLIRLGDNVAVARDVTLDGRGGLYIGKNTMIGFESVILTTLHKHDALEIPMRFQGIEKKEVRIGEDVWIGCRVIILPGISIGNKSIIGAGSVVSKNIPAYSIAAGNPVKIIKRRDG